MLRLASLVAALLVAGTTAAAAAVSADGDRVTICHKSDQHARTMEVSSASWGGHQRHGDHKGACTSAELAGTTPGPGTGTPPAPPASPLALRAEGEGDLDGDARFRIVVDHDANDAHDVRVEGRLWGEGRWTVESESSRCAIARDRLSCPFGVLASGDDRIVRLAFDGPAITVCRDVGLELTLTAANDATAGDDVARSEVPVGACSVNPWDSPV